MKDIAEKIIHKLGGEKIVAEMTGLDVSRIYRWTYPKERGGTGGIIPAQHQQTILDGAKEIGVSLHPKDFFEDAR